MENTVARRELVIALLAMTCMVPFCTWLSSFGGLVGISAASNDAFYGRYVVLMAAAGLLAVLGDDLLPAWIPLKAVIAGVGLGTTALTALDYIGIVRHNADSGPFMAPVAPGLGMYLALLLGIALALTALFPRRKRASLVAERPVLRPGSRD